MVKPYTAVGLIPSVRGIRRRKDIKINLDHLQHLVKAASWLSALDIPVRLIAIPEGALQAFNDEVLDLDHVKFARECAIDIPGEETEELGKIAREYDAFIMAQAKARHPDLKDRFFNVGFILDPKGKVILKHYKVSPLFPVEHSVCPHDVYDWWIEKYGRNLDAFWPVADTAIGRLGIMMANEGSSPENARALALNGAEAGVVDIEALRDHRARAQWDNWLKDLRTELYQMLYEQPIYPKNLYLHRAPMKHEEYREQVIKPQIRLMHERGIWVEPER